MIGRSARRPPAGKNTLSKRATSQELFGLPRHGDSLSAVLAFSVSHVTGAAAKFVGERWRFVKQRRGGAPIDALIAASMAVRVLLADEDRPKVDARVHTPSNAAFFL